MYYYSSHSNIPVVGQVLVGQILLEKEEETCIYVRIPEYNNIEGIIPKSNLPKKRRIYAKVLAQMKKDKQIPCVVKFEPRVDADSKLWPLDLSILTADDLIKHTIVGRFENMSRILKLFKFLAEETNTPFTYAVQGLADLMPELSADDLMDKDQTVLSDLSDLYIKLISDVTYLLSVMRFDVRVSDDVPPDTQSDTQSDAPSFVRSVMSSCITVKKSDCTICFDFRINSGGQSNSTDPVKILRDTFTHVMYQHPTMSIQYKGAPSYAAIMPDVSIDDLPSKIDSIQKCFTDYLEAEYRDCKFDLLFDITKAEAKKPQYFMTYPREITIE